MLQIQCDFHHVYEKNRINIYCELNLTKHYNNKGRKDGIGKKVFINNAQPPYQSMAPEYLVRCLCIRKGR